MKLGIALPHYPFSFPAPSAEPVARQAIRYAQLAEELRFHQVWVSDHFFVNVAPPSQPAQREEPSECWTLLSAIAASTSRLRIGSLANPVGFRNPALLVRMAETVNEISGGRLDVTLGAGWNEAEYRENGLPFPHAADRLRALAGAVDLMQRRCTDVPVWVGGKRPKLLNIAASAAGWNVSWDITTSAYQRQTQLLERGCRQRDRDPASVRRSIGLTTLIGRDADDLTDCWRRLQRWVPCGALGHVSLREWAKTRLVGTVDEVRRQIANWRAEGVEQIVCALGVPFSVWSNDQLELLSGTLT